jgi:hypothetical protein
MQYRCAAAFELPFILPSSGRIAVSFVIEKVLKLSQIHIAPHVPPPRQRIGGRQRIVKYLIVVQVKTMIVLKESQNGNFPAVDGESKRGTSGFSFSDILRFQVGKIGGKFQTKPAVIKSHTHPVWIQGSVFQGYIVAAVAQRRAEMGLGKRKGDVVEMPAILDVSGIRAFAKGKTETSEV